MKGIRCRRRSLQWGSVLSTALVAGVAVAEDAGTLAVEANYLGEVIRNVDGGLERGGTYLDRLDLVLAGPLGSTGIDVRVHGMYTNAARFSERYVGDAMTVSNIDAERGVRLYEAWIEWSGGTRGPSSLRVGLYDLNSEFDTSDLRATFTNSVFGIGHDVAQTGDAGPSIFPNTAFGLRGRLALGERWHLQAVALDAVPGSRTDPGATAIRFGDGALLAGELHRYGDRLTKLAVGAWTYTRESEPLADSRSARKNRGAYVSTDFALHGDFAAGQGSGAFVRVGVADQAVNEYDAFATTGIAFRRDAGELERSVGIGLAVARASDAYRELLALDAGRAERYEGVVELTLRAAVTPWLLLQPHVQFVRNPAADPRLDDAWVVGMRFELGASLPLSRR